MAEMSSAAQQPTTPVETSSPAEPNGTEIQATTTTNAGIGASQNEVSDLVSNRDKAQEPLLSISTILEDNALALREEEEGKKMLLRREFVFNKRGQPPNLVLPSAQEPGVMHWKPNEKTLASWKAYRTEQPTPAGQIWWMVDTTGGKESGLGVKYSCPRYMRIDQAVLLIECLMQGTVERDEPGYEEFPYERLSAEVFICSYLKPSDRIATGSLCNTFKIQAMRVSKRRLPDIDNLHLQYHLVYLRYLPWSWRSRDLESLSEHRPGLKLERHSAQIRRLSYARTPGATSAGQTSKEISNYQLSEELFEECRLSILLEVYGKGGEFRLILVGDTGAEVNMKPGEPFKKRHGSSSLLLDPNSLGHLAGLTHFLVNLVHLLDTWHAGWKETLNKIDDIVGFEMHHTFDDRQLESHIFDTSDSMDLSKQYFTTLQLLRIARQRIEDDLSAWKDLREVPDNNQEPDQLLEVPDNNRDLDRLHKSPSTHPRVLSTLDRFALSEGGEPMLKKWEEQRDMVTQLFEKRAKHLTERIDQKTKEVESLRDGLFNATSLREAMKGMALNRAIYLFTAVTIIFTPLSFLTALWALPILNTTPEGDSIRPSSNAFLITFIIIPALTYMICGYYAWYLTSTKTWKTFSKFLRYLPGNLYFVWDVCAIYALYPFSERTRQTCAYRVRCPSEAMPGYPGWALRAMTRLSKVGKGSSHIEPA